MITKDEIVQIIHTRQNKFEIWLKKKPEKFSVKKLKKEMKFWSNEIDYAKKVTKENDPLFPKNDLGNVYTFLNEAVATQNSYYVALLYIKKLEEKIDVLNSQ